MDKELREYEIKYSLPLSRVCETQNLLEALCHRDALYPKSTVCSLYYDTPKFQLLYEKINSDYLKTKIRARWYLHQSDDAVFLEIKNKIGTQRTKFRLRTQFNAPELEKEPLHSQKLLGLLTLLNSETRDLPGPLFPMLTIQYERLRYVDPVLGLRISLDSGIHIARSNLTWVRRLPPGVDRAVLEIKGQAESLPHHLSYLFRLGIRKEAFSKYSQMLLQI